MKLFESKPAQLIRLVAALVALCGAVGCSRGKPSGGGGDDEEIGESQQALAEGRLVKYADFASDGVGAAEREWSTTAATEILYKACATQLTEQPSPWLTTSGAVMGHTQCGAGVLNITVGSFLYPVYNYRDATAFGRRCAGHLALQIASSVKPQYLVRNAGSLELVSEPGSSQVEMKISPQQATHAASWALLATDLFRSSLSDYLDAANTSACRDLFPNASPPSPNGPGPTFGEFIASGIVDALGSMMEAGEVAQKHALAAANAKRGSTQQEAPEAVTHAWRDRHDSRLEVASIYAPISLLRYEPAYAIGISNLPGLFPVATLLPGSTGEKRAEELLRSTRANPCLTGMGSWCAEALSGISSRVAASVWTDIAVLLGSAGGNLATASSSSILAKSGITLAELERAARRIVQEAEVLGRPIVPDPSSTLATRRVLGTARTSEKPSPYYLYATTAGRVPWEKYAPGSNYIFNATPGTAWSTPPGPGYFDSSISSAAENAGARLDAILPSLSPTASYTAMLTQTRAYAREYAPTQMRLRIRPNASSPRIDTVDIEVTRGLPFASNQMSSSCGVWLGEAGLACGLTDSYDGVRCPADKYRFNRNQVSWGYNGLAGWATVPATSAPPRAWINGGSPTLIAGDRIYLICDVAQGQTRKREVLFATELTYPSSGSVAAYEWRAYLPPMSDATLRGLSDALAADPSTPAQSGLSCAGVPYDVRLALEDEITEAFTGQDNIESSFAYYLKLAREAADRADKLGEELVEQGLQMDMRAEQARDELENLCGGVVDVPSLRAHCPPANPNCDVLQLLTDSLVNPATAAIPGSVDLAGIARCLGLTGQPVAAAVGDQPLCMWKYGNNPPMVCPIIASGGGPIEDPTCAGLSRVPKIADPSSTRTCAQLLELNPSVTTITAQQVDKTLNLVVTDHNTETGSSGGGPTMPPCVDALLKLRYNESPYPENYASTYPVSNENWTTERDLRKVADAIGFEHDIFGFPTVKINGSPWIRLGDGENGYKAGEENLNFWPLIKHPSFGPSWTHWLDDVVCPGQGNPSLFCMYNQTTVSLLDLGNRLGNAVLALKGITGADPSNITLSYPDPVQPSMILTDLEQLVQPAWMGGGIPGADYWLSVDGSRMSYWCPAGACGNHLGKWSYNVMSSAATAFGGGYIPAQLLWGNDNCTGTGQIRGCGDMRRLIKGESVPTVRSQAYFEGDVCPPLPSDPPREISLLTRCKRASGSEDCSILNDAYVYVSKDAAGKRGNMGLPGGTACACDIGESVGLDVPRQIVNAYPGNIEARSLRFIKKDLQDYACTRNATLGTAVPRGVVLDALELACAAQMSGNAMCSPLQAQPLEIDSVDDFPKVRGRIQCAADTLQENLDHMYVLDVPTDVVDAIASAGPVQTYPQYRGEYGEVVPQLGAKLLAMRRLSDVAVTQLRKVAEKFTQARTQAQINDLNIASSSVEAAIQAGTFEVEKLHYKEERVRTRQAIANQITSCANAIAAAASWSDAVFSSATNITQSAITCTNSVVQIKAELELKSLAKDIQHVKGEIQQNVQKQIDLGEDISEEQKTLVMQTLAADLAEAMDNLNSGLHEIKEAQAEVHSLLARLDGIRRKARRTAAKLLMLETDGLEGAYAVNSTMLARMNTLRVRYEQAREGAIRLSYLARRSVEQRLGVDMSLMEDDLTLVSAPRSWVDGLCTLTGIDYSKIRTGGRTLKIEATDAGAPSATYKEGSGESSEPYSYADAYIGDWLTKLENFVESYRLDYPFQDGGDLAVVSVRDEIVRTRRECSLPGWNELYFTSGPMPETASVEVSNASFEERSVWDYTCQNGRQATVARPRVLPQESLFECGDAFAGSCRPLGDAKPVQIVSSAVDNCASGTTSEVGSQSGSLPSTGLVYRYRADHCSVTAVQGQPVCTDLDANAAVKAGGVPLVQDWGQPISLSSSAVGSRPALSMQGTGLSRAASPTTYSSYTMSYVFRAGSPASAYLAAHWGVASGSQQPLTELALGGASGVSGMHSVVQTADYLTSSARQQSVFGMAPVAPPSRPTQGDIITVRGGPQGLELYINGVLRSRGSQPALVTALGGLPIAGGDQLLFSEAVAYGRWLDDTELRALHVQLAAYYAVALEAPVYWLSGDATYSSGASVGYSFPVGTLYDAASGLARSDATPALEARSTVSFGASSRALSFSDSASEFVAFRPLSRVDQIAQAGGAVVSTASAVSEYAVTIAARCNEGMQRIFSTNGDTSTTRTVLQINCTNGVVQYSDVIGTQAQTPHASAVGVVMYGAPFVITLRGSASLGTTQIFVNGARVATNPAYLPVALAPRFGGGEGQSFGGQIADGMVHLHAMSDAQIVALHAQLQSKHGIVTTPSGAGGSGSVAAGSSGPARIRQAVSVGKGDYWFSWYQLTYENTLSVHFELPDGTSQTRTPAKTVQDSIWPDGTQPGKPAGALEEAWMSPGWVRYFVRVSVPSGGTMHVGFVAPTTAAWLAGPQLERFDQDKSNGPKEYFPTSDKRTRVVANCEDTDGDVFRGMWRQGHEYYCPPGLGTHCAADGNVQGLPKRHYYELSFPISLEAIERGELMSSGGFAKGNFNYRFDRVAVNVVGTAVKDCQKSGLPTTCYAANFMQYSLHHSPPFRIRNYDGDVIDAPLFSGSIQQAKGLLAERYLSNPVSSADQGLLGEYWRDEFKGRPIDGNFTLRVYDDTGFDFEQLRDVQLALDYRYWTRFER